MVFSFIGNRHRQETDGSAALARGLAEVRAYWEALRGDGGIPVRSALDPRGMAGALDRVFIAERIGTGLLRMRIAGMALADLAGMDMKGLPLSAIFAPEARIRLANCIERVFSLPAVAEIHLEAERGIGRPTLSARLMLLPLLSNSGQRDLVLGCLAMQGDVGRAPRRLSITTTVEERLVLPATPAEESPLAMVFAEPAAPPPRPVTGKPRLRLVHSAD